MVRSVPPGAGDDAGYPAEVHPAAGLAANPAGAFERVPAQEIDLRTVASALRRRRRFILLPSLVVLVLVGVYVNVATPRYTAQSQILLENQESFFTRPDRTASLSETAQLDEIAVASQVQIITSHDLARRAIAKLHLVGNSEFDAGTGLLTKLLQALHLSKPTPADAIESRIVDSFEQKLVVFSPPKTRVVTVEFTSRDADLAARAANTVAELYIAEQAAAKRSQARTAADALSEQIADLRGKLAKADAERERYRSTSGLLAGTNNLTISGQQVADLNTDLSRARAVQADAQAKASTIRSLLRQGKAADVAEVTNNEIVRRIWDQRTTAQGQLALESRTLLPGHPRVKELQAQVEGFDATLRQAAKQLATTLENEAAIAGARVGNLETALGQQKTAAGVANGDEVHLRALERIAQGYKEQLESSTTKYEEALARESSLATPADARIISRALPPQLPSFPKKLPFVAFGTIATLVLLSGWVIAGELLSGRALVGAVPPEERPDEPGRPIEALPPAGRREDVREPAPVTARPSSRPGTAAATSAAPSVAAPVPARASASLPMVAATAAAPVPVPSRGALTSGGVTATILAGLAALRAGFGAGSGGRWSTLVGYARRFGASAAQSGRHRADAGSPDACPPDAAAWQAEAVDDPVLPDAGRPARFFSGDGTPAVAAAARAEPWRQTLDRLSQRIVAMHVPGRGLHIVGSGVGEGADAADKLVALARVLSERGRALLVDLGTQPARLAALMAAGQGDVAALPGLSELLAGDSSFAEVIHRDRASRLHFIPTGALEADFRDFDLILDALSQTYDLILLLAPSYPRSEIARVMAPYADVVVLAATVGADGAVLRALESDMVEAGARDVLVIDQPPAREVA